ncbi:hypothetical protein Hanom_Chr05g00427511 [Helianthus anomalus]
MSGEGSASGAVGRKRGPQTCPRGETLPLPPDFGKRQIEYRSAGVPHGQSTRLKDSPLLQFALNSNEQARLAELITVDLLPYRRIDWDMVDRLGQRERIEQLLGEKFRLVLDCDAPQCKELMLEFHATFEYKQGSYEEKDAVSFSLGRKVYEMTIP